MATVSTEWALNLGGNILDSIKGMVSGVKEAIGSVEELGENWELSGKETREALAQEEAAVNEINKELEEQKKALEDIQEAWDKATPGAAWDAGKKAVEDQQKEIENLEEKLWNTSENAKTLEEDLGQLSQKKEINIGGNILDSIKNMMSGVKGYLESIQDVGLNWGLSQKKTKEALAQEEAALKEIRKELSANEKKLKDLEKATKGAAAGEQWGKAKKAVEDQKVVVEKLAEKLWNAGENAKTLKEDMEGFSKSKKSLFEVATAANQISEIVGKITRALDFAVDVKNLRTEFEKLTDLTGKDLDKFLSKSREIADVYKTDAKTVGQAANTLTQQMGGSYESNLNIIEEGLKRGANVNGDYLSILQRYAPALQEMGVSAEEATSLIATAAKKGVDPSSFIESIQKAGVEIRKMTDKTEEALADIGVKRADLEGKTAMQAVQHITAAMDGMTEQAKQMTISKIFKTQGERSGAEFIMGISKGIPPLDEIPAVEETASGFKRLFSNIKTWAGDAFGVAGEYVQTFGPAIQLIAGAIPIMTALGNSAAFATVKQWLLNIALNANPIGLIVIGIAALIAGIALVITYWEDWGAAVTVFMGPIGLVISMIQSLRTHWESIKQAFQDGGIIAGLKRIGIVLLDALLKPIEQLLGWLSKIPGMGGLAAKGAEAIGKMRENLDLKETEEKDKEEDSAFNLNQTLKDPNGLSFDDPDGKKGKDKGGNGLNVGSGAGGVKNIAMTLNVVNNFAVSKDSNVRDIADKIVGMVNDRLRDSLVTV